MEKPIYVTRPELPPLTDYVEKLEEIWAGKWLTNMGPMHERFKEKLKAYLNVEHLELFTNGHLALESLLDAYGLEGEVITTPFTFVSTTHAIIRKGLTPVFCDINEDDYTMDASMLESLVTPRTTAILPVHVYGHVCDDDAISRTAKKHGLKVIYDAAHAFGIKKDGKSVLELGDASMVSFHATKVFNTVEGGAAVCREPDIIHKLAVLKDFGICSESECELSGGNAKLDELRAAMGLCNLDYTEENISSRKKIYKYYCSRLGGRKGIRIYKLPENISYNYSYFPILVEKAELGIGRDEIYENLKKHQIFTRKYFYPLTTNFKCYQERFCSVHTPVAEFVSENILTLPLYSGLSSREVGQICDLIEEMLTH